MHGFNNICSSDMDFDVTTRMKVNRICFVYNNRINALVTENISCILCPVNISGTKNGCPVIFH